MKYMQLQSEKHMKQKKDKNEKVNACVKSYDEALNRVFGKSIVDVKEESLNDKQFNT